MAFDGRASVMTQQRQGLQAETNALHSKTMGAWANAQLQSRGMRVDDIGRDMSDGRALIALVEVLSGQPCPESYCTTPPSNPHQKVVNAAVAIKFAGSWAKQAGAADPTALARGDVKTILALLWALILRSGALSKGKGGEEVEGALRERVLQWVRARTNGYKHVNIVDLSTSFADGMAFCALVHSMQPGLLDYDQFTPRYARLVFPISHSLHSSAALTVLLAAGHSITIESLSLLPPSTWTYRHFSIQRTCAIPIQSRGRTTNV